MKKLAVFWARLLKCNCSVRVNTLIIAAIPMLEQVGMIWPTFREHLPANVYGVGFVVLGLANVLLHARTAAQIEKRDADNSVLGN